MAIPPTQRIEPPPAQAVEGQVEPFDREDGRLGLSANALVGRIGVAERTVLSEPVSGGRFSLLTGKITGNFAILGAYRSPDLRKIS